MYEYDYIIKKKKLNHLIFLSADSINLHIEDITKMILLLKCLYKNKIL